MGLAILSILGLQFAGMAGVDIAEGAWPVLVVLPPLALIFAVLFIIVLIIVSAVRRSRAARDAV